MTRKYVPAVQRNRQPIAEVLERELPESGLVLEIASGSGEHAAWFAKHFPHLDWQPTDPDPAALASIAAWAEEAGLPNLRLPLELDAQSGNWPVTAADALLCINMVHISPWTATEGLLAGAAQVLPHGGKLILYGPYLEDDVDTAPSNLAFDADLKARDRSWGLRNLHDVDVLAGKCGLERMGRYTMPANNIMPVYLRT